MYFVQYFIFSISQLRLKIWCTIAGIRSPSNSIAYVFSVCGNLMYSGSDMVVFFSLRS